VAVLIRPLLLAALSACVLATPAFAVFGGKPVGSGDLVAKSVAAVLEQDAQGAHLCTATALGPRLMLTAAHCTDGGAKGMKVIFATTLAAVPLERLRNVTAIARGNKTADAKGSFAYNNPDDIALIVLDAPVPAGTAFASLTDGSGTGAVRVAGYGATSDYRNALFGKGEAGFDRTLRAAATSLAAKGAVLVADQSHGAGVCTGDSGGPAFTVAGKSLRVAGVLIGVSAPKSANDFCRGSAHYVSIPRWRDWIVSTAAKLGQPLR
jgi:secreted trypsin-like serine protease